MLFMALTVPARVAGQDEPRANCTLTGVEARWVQAVLGGWEQVSTGILELELEGLPWVVLFNRTCAWHLAPDRMVLREAESVTPGLTYAGETLPVSAVPHDGVVWLPNGSSVPVEGLAFTSIYQG